MSECKDLLGALSDYLDGDEQSAMCAELRRHMATCEKCRVVVNSSKRTLELYRDHTQVAEIPVDTQIRLRKTLSQAWNAKFPSSR